MTPQQSPAGAQNVPASPGTPLNPDAPATPGAAPRVLCPYCGSPTTMAARCEHCRGLLDPLSRQATQNAMGPWFLHDPQQPFRPGCSYETICDMVRRGKITRDQILRGPTTRQFWSLARRTPSIANLLGLCHNCQKPVEPTDILCPGCGADFTPESDRQFLGLGPVHAIPGQPLPPAAHEPHHRHGTSSREPVSLPNARTTSVPRPDREVQLETALSRLQERVRSTSAMVGVLAVTLSVVALIAAAEFWRVGGLGPLVRWVGGAPPATAQTPADGSPHAATAAADGSTNHGGEAGGSTGALNGSPEENAEDRPAEVIKPVDSADKSGGGNGPRASQQAANGVSMESNGVDASSGLTGKLTDTPAAADGAGKLPTGLNAKSEIEQRRRAWHALRGMP